ncbi:amino acid adenylation domain-containing protein [Streptomyces sp. MUM 2J]|nr:amino acid adenylation domain-containing protein [Streptomyces sp. MUM 2J]
MFADRVDRHPSRPSLRAADGRSWTYAELRACAVALAADLARLGVGRGDRVAVLGGRTADTVVALLGVLHAGAAYCVIDPSVPLTRRDLILSDLAPVALVIADLAEGPPASDHLPVVRLADRTDLATSSWQPVDGDADDDAYVIYTSGSTGIPKGIVVQHSSVLNMLSSYEALAPAPEAFTASLLAPPSFDVSVWEIFSAFLYGGCLHVPDQACLLDGDALWGFLGGDAIQSAYIPPGLLAPMVQAAEQEGEWRAARLLVGVEPIPQGLLARLATAVPGLRIVNGYGPTETTITATLHLVGPVGDPHHRVPIGRAVAGSTIEVVDELLEPVPQGEVGEILVSGACLARGYLDGHSRGFIKVRGRRVFRTGDFGRFLPGGVLEFSGRRDGQVKLRGFRVELAEVEAALNAVEGIRRAVVFTTGESGEKRLIAAVEAPAYVRRADIRNQLADQLPPHAMPSRIMVLPTFPVTANGKVATDALLAMDQERPASAKPFVAPRTEWESRVAAAWSEVLSVNTVGIDDNFHELGGTSLDAIHVAARLRDDWRPVSTAAVLSRPTIRALADGVTDTQQVRVAPVGPGTYPTDRAQEGLWAWRELHADATATTVVHAIRLDGPVDVARMCRGFTAVVARHESLRTTFVVNADDRLEQRVSAPTMAVDLPVNRVGSASEVDELLRLRLDQRFDVTVRPWEAELVLGDDFAVLIFAADHMVFDGESAEVLQRDLAAAYGDPGIALRQVGGSAALHPLLTPAADRRDVLHAYWRKALAGFRAQPALPPPAPSHRTDRRVHVLKRAVSTATWQSVLELARQAGTTPFTVVLAALKAFLRQRTGASPQTVTIAISQRRSVDCADAVGHFVNLVPVYDQLSTDAYSRLSFADYVGQVAVLARQAVEHGDLSYEDILADLPGSAARGDSGLAQVVLSQQVQSLAPPVTASDGLRFQPWREVPVNSMYDVSVFLTEAAGADATRIEWAVDAAKTLAGSPERTASAFAAFLDAAVAAPLTSIAALEPPAQQGLETATEAVHGRPRAASRALDRPPVSYTSEESRPEAVVHRIWADLLEAPELGPDDDVFEFGANSMMVLSASRNISRELGTKVPAHIVYSEPTARLLAARLTSENVHEEMDSRVRGMRDRADRVRRSRSR